jgi:hypothetical protein
VPAGLFVFNFPLSRAIAQPGSRPQTVLEIRPAPALPHLERVAERGMGAMNRPPVFAVVEEHSRLVPPRLSRRGLTHQDRNGTQLRDLGHDDDLQFAVGCEARNPARCGANPRTRDEHAPIKMKH